MKKRNLPIWPVDVDKWMGSTIVRLMSVTAEGIYMRLCMAQWADGQLPNDESKLARLAKADQREWRTFTEFLDDVFPVCEDGYRRNPRVERDREWVLEKIGRRQASGSLGGKAKANQTGSKSVANATDTLKQNGSNDDSKRLAIIKTINNEIKKEQKETLFSPDGETLSFQILENQYPEPIGPNAVEPEKPIEPGSPFASFRDFLDQFSLAYPENQFIRCGEWVGRSIPSKAQDKLKDDWRKHGTAIIEGAKAYGRHREWLTSSGKFCPQVCNIGTFVNQKRWRDDYTIPEENPVGLKIETSPIEPRDGVDYEWFRDPETDSLMKVVIGTQTPFDESEWQRRAA